MLAGAMEHAWAFCTQLHSFPQQNKKQFCMKPWCVSDGDQISWYFSESNSTYCEWCSVPGSEISSALCQYLHTPRFFDILHSVFYSAPEATICCILVSYPPPACFLGPDLRVIIVSISHSVHIDAAGLQVDLLLSELQNS